MLVVVVWWCGVVWLCLWWSCACRVPVLCGDGVQIVQIPANREACVTLGKRHSNWGGLVWQNDEAKVFSRCMTDYTGSTLQHIVGGKGPEKRS